MKKIVPLFFVAVIAGIAIAVKYLPWWALLLGGLLLIVVGKFVIKRLFFKLLLKPFQLKGAVLKGATAEIHSVTPTTAAPSEDAEPDATPRSWYALEVTITPGPSNTPFGAWEPGELRLVLPESKLDTSPDSPSDNDDSCTIKAIGVQQDGSFQADEGMKYPGPQRLRLVIAVKPGISRLKFRYYFEEFGSVTLPASALANAA
jgi:hypothetical protein